MQPTQGRIVLYSMKIVNDAELILATYPAIIISVEESGLVNLTVFFDHKYSSTEILGSPTSVPYSKTPKEHTWRWPEIVAGVDLAAPGTKNKSVETEIKVSAKKKK